MKFVLESENTSKRWEFEINMTLNQFRAWQETQEYPREISGRVYLGNHYEDFVSDMESYGVLDAGGGNETELYHSYEIEEDDFPVVLEEFKEFFKEKGLPVS